MEVYLPAGPEHQITGRISKSEYQYTLQSSDTETLYDVAPEMRDRIAKIDGLRDVTTDLYIRNPQMAVEIDREKAAVYGITDRPDPAGTVQRVRQRARWRRSTRPPTIIRSSWRAMPEFQDDPPSCRRYT